MLGDAPTAHEVFIERFSKSSSPGSVARNQRLRADGSLHFRAEIALFGNNCSPVVPQRLFSGLPKSTDISSHGRLCETWNHNGYSIRAAANVTGREYRMRRLVSIVEKKTVVRARDLYRSRVHQESLSRALQRVLLLKIGRGLYARKDFSADFERQIMLACKRVPNGIVCLKSAVRFHGLLPVDAASIWMAIDFKAKKPVASGLKLRFVRFSGKALTQGVEKN